MFCFKFQCVNGRVVLNLQNHQWNLTEMSSSFRDAKTAAEFVTMWQRMKESGSGSSMTTHSGNSLPVQTTDIVIETSNVGASNFELPSCSHSISDHDRESLPPSTKKYKLAVSNIDESIEKLKVGKSA